MGDKRIDLWFCDDSKQFEEDFFIWIKGWLINFGEIDKFCFPGKLISWDSYYEKIDKCAL